jgi:hypothetical protein
MFDWIGDNTWVVVLVIYALYAIFGKKKTATVKDVANQKATPVQGRKSNAQYQQGTMATATPPAATAPQEKYRSRIEEALRNAMQEADREFFETRPPSGEEPREKPLPPKIVAIPETAKADEDPFAFHSLMNGGEKGRIDYDLTSEDYDKRNSAFAFHEAIAEPIEKEFHLTGFSGFHAAGGLTAAERRKAAGDDAYAEAASGPAFSIGNRDELLRAIIIQEVLGKPKARR